MIVGLVYTGHHLAPLDAVDAEALKRFYEPGETLMVDVKKARNIGHHRKWFALLQTALDNTEKYRTLEDLLVETKIRAGWYREHITARGELVFVPRSISFEAADQSEFDEFYPKAVVALNEIVPGIPNVEAEVDEALR